MFLINHIECIWTCWSPEKRWPLKVTLSFIYPTPISDLLVSLCSSPPHDESALPVHLFLPFLPSFKCSQTKQTDAESAAAACIRQSYRRRHHHGCQMAIAGFLESYEFGPSGFWTMAPLRCAAKFDPFLSLDCAWVERVGAQSKERKGYNFAA